GWRKMAGVKSGSPVSHRHPLFIAGGAKKGPESCDPGPFLFSSSPDHRAAPYLRFFTTFFATFFATLRASGFFAEAFEPLAPAAVARFSAIAACAAARRAMGTRYGEQLT